MEKAGRIRNYGCLVRFGGIGVIPRVTETRIDKVKLFPSRLIEQHEQSSGQERIEQEE